VDALQDRVEVRVAPETELGVVQVRPEGEEAETEKSTAPLKPLRGVTVMVEVAGLLAVSGDGVTAPADTVKSTTWKMMEFVVRVTNEPLTKADPVTVTV
jgi:hypothetical protein